MAVLNGRIVNPNFKHLYETWLKSHHSKFESPKGAILEGSSRSQKTWCGIDFLIWLCSAVETQATFNIIKETYNSFKTTLYDDFNRHLPDFGISSPFAERQEVSSFRLFGNKINLLGGDSETVHQGVSCDYFWINEALDVSQNVFDQAEMRCRKFWWVDYNPKFTDHWFYDRVCGRDDVSLLRSTYKDNPHISPAERAKIESYEPNEKNVRQGTADDYKWNVYGLGLRSAPEGLVFQHVTWIDKFPDNCEKIFWGLDFGYTNSPSCLVKVGVIGTDLFAQKLFYTPTPSINELSPLVSKFCEKGTEIWCDPSGDSGGRGMIASLRRPPYSFRAMSTNTFPGSILFGVSVLKKFKLHLVDDPDVRKEQGMYRYREINGIKLDEPEDDFNHFWDALRMPVMSRMAHLVAKRK